MTPLAAALAARIAREGPITVADFMAAALGDPEHGYYKTRDPLGEAGDFITAPEVSQMFGEIIGVWALTVFDRLGAPKRIRLIELGPGRGTLMADLLRAAKIRPGFGEAAEIHLVETSPVLREKQKEALGETAAQWHEDLGDALKGGGPVIVIANEFFDALPVHHLEMTENGWRERMVAFDPASEEFHFVLAKAPTDVCGLVPPELAESASGAIFEVSPVSRRLMGALTETVVAQRGAALVIDYGHTRAALGETLQAVRGHRYHGVLAGPGSADLTAHVDFEALARIARDIGAAVTGPLTQGEFLRGLGIVARAQALTAANPDQGPQIEAALERLIGTGKMGSLFKALLADSPDLGPLERTGGHDHARTPQ